MHQALCMIAARRHLTKRVERGMDIRTRVTLDIREEYHSLFSFQYTYPKLIPGTHDVQTCTGSIQPLGCRTGKHSDTGFVGVEKKTPRTDGYAGIDFEA